MASAARRVCQQLWLELLVVNYLLPEVIRQQHHCNSRNTLLRIESPEDITSPADTGAEEPCGHIAHFELV